MTRGYEASLVEMWGKRRILSRKDLGGIIGGAENQKRAPCPHAFPSHPFLPAIGLQNLELKENLKDIKSGGFEPSYASESPWCLQNYKLASTTIGDAFYRQECKMGITLFIKHCR